MKLSKCCESKVEKGTDWILHDYICTKCGKSCDTIEQNEGVDMGINSTCIVCNKRYCTCPERQLDRSWKTDQPKEETKEDWVKNIN